MSKNKGGMTVDNRFNVVYCDFPWSYRQSGITRSGGIKPIGSAAHYETMTLETIKQFPIHDILAADGILFLWVPVPQKLDAVHVIEGWTQLQYKTTIFWRKLNKGLGHWARGCVEELWLLVKGDVKALGWQGLNILEEKEGREWFPVGWIKSKIGPHSKKPHKMYDMIEEMTAPFSELKKKVELFATETRQGWTSVGWDIGSDVYEFAKHLRLEGKPHERSSKNCAVCGWDVREIKEEGCVPGDCSHRPQPEIIYDPYRARLEGALKPFKVAA